MYHVVPQILCLKGSTVYYDSCGSRSGTPGTWRFVGIFKPEESLHPLPSFVTWINVLFFNFPCISQLKQFTLPSWIFPFLFPFPLPHFLPFPFHFPIFSSLRFPWFSFLVYFCSFPPAFWWFWPRLDRPLGQYGPRPFIIWKNSLSQIWSRTIFEMHTAPGACLVHKT